jgi:DNA (cytosine-5)-methyltransferase 1
MTFGSLFAGIGGFDLGLERAGMRCSWQVEIDPYARRVLEKHWPDVRRHEDVRIFPPPGDWGVDLVCGGFPCQDISNAGKRVGIEGERSGLWREYARIIGVLRPRFVLVENVSALLVRGMGRVLGDLSTLGYDAEWDVISAASVGAPHIRERVWIVAYAKSARRPSSGAVSEQAGASGITFGRGKNWIDGSRDQEVRNAIRDPVRAGLESGKCLGQNAREKLASTQRANMVDRAGWWCAEPDVGRVADGVPDRVDRITCLGNAIVPQVAEFIGRRLMESISQPVRRPA